MVVSVSFWSKYGPKAVSLRRRRDKSIALDSDSSGAGGDGSHSLGNPPDGFFDSSSPAVYPADFKAQITSTGHFGTPIPVLSEPKKLDQIAPNFARALERERLESCQPYKSIESSAEESIIELLVRIALFEERLVPLSHVALSS